MNVELLSTSRPITCAVQGAGCPWAPAEHCGQGSRGRLTQQGTGSPSLPLVRLCGQLCSGPCVVLPCEVRQAAVKGTLSPRLGAPCLGSRCCPSPPRAVPRVTSWGSCYVELHVNSISAIPFLGILVHKYFLRLLVLNLNSICRIILIFNGKLKTHFRSQSPELLEKRIKTTHTKNPLRKNPHVPVAVIGM